MHSILYHLHYYNRYLILVALVFVLYRSYSGWLGRKSYEKVDNAASAALLGFSHLQLLLGILMYIFTSPRVQLALSDFGGAMKDSTLRYFAVEHALAMLIAITLIQLGRTFSKKAGDPVEKHRKLAIYTTIAFLIIVGTLAMKGILFSSATTGN